VPSHVAFIAYEFNEPIRQGLGPALMRRDFLQIRQRKNRSTSSEKTAVRTIGSRRTESDANMLARSLLPAADARYS
jgi:hypothetical protein